MRRRPAGPVEHHGAETRVAHEHRGAVEPVAYAAGWYEHLDLLAPHVGGR